MNKLKTISSLSLALISILTIMIFSIVSVSYIASRTPDPSTTEIAVTGYANPYEGIPARECYKYISVELLHGNTVDALRSDWEIQNNITQEVYSAYLVNESLVVFEVPGYTVDVTVKYIPTGLSYTPHTGLLEGTDDPILRLINDSQGWDESSLCYGK